MWMYVLIGALLALIGATGAAYLVEGIFFPMSATRAVYMGSNLAEQAGVLREIVSTYVPNAAACHLVEPGAGIGHVSRFLLREYPWKSATAIELRPTVYAAGRLLAWRRFPSLRYRRQDLLTYRYRPGSVIYCYLTSPLITGLYRRGAFKGSLVICLTFAIEGIEPAKKYPLPGWQRVIRVYDFR